MPPLSAFPATGLRLALCALPLVWLWGVLLNHLRVEWTLNAQYGYGFAVPFLCLFLLVRNLRHSSLQFQVSGLQSPVSVFSFQVLFALCAFCYLPTRLIQLANPDWRFVSWALALEVIGLTFCFLRLVPRSPATANCFSISAFTFPLFFFLVAVPWPTLIESSLIQSLTRLDVAATCELAGWIGIPAVPHGNVIEVATGQVGIDEACSGIRSFQATLMISLFLGEYYRISALRRLTLCLAGFSLAVLLNLIRQLVLVWVAAHQGIPAIAKWHDPTGVIILLGCFSGLWGLGLWLARGTEGRSQKPEVSFPVSSLRSQLSAFRFPLSAFALTVWLLLVEVGVEGWYRWHEARLPAAITWQVAWPTNNATLKEREIAPATRQLLRFDEGRNCYWQNGEQGYQAFFLRWYPGSVAVRLAQNHTPAICFPAAGHTISAESDLQTVTVHGLELPFRFYQAGDAGQSMFVAYCLWEDRASTRKFSNFILTRYARLAPVLAGQRNLGQRSLEIGITGVNGFAEGRAALQTLLEEIITPSP